MILWICVFLCIYIGIIWYYIKLILARSNAIPFNFIHWISLHVKQFASSSLPKRSNSDAPQPGLPFIQAAIRIKYPRKAHALDEGKPSSSTVINNPFLTLSLMTGWNGQIRTNLSTVSLRRNNSLRLNDHMPALRFWSNTNVGLQYLTFLEMPLHFIRLRHPIRVSPRNSWDFNKPCANRNQTWSSTMCQIRLWTSRAKCGPPCSLVQSVFQHGICDVPSGYHLPQIM